MDTAYLLPLPHSHSHSFSPSPSHSVSLQYDDSSDKLADGSDLARPRRASVPRQMSQLQPLYSLRSIYPMDSQSQGLNTADALYEIPDVETPTPAVSTSRSVSQGFDPEQSYHQPWPLLVEQNQGYQYTADAYTFGPGSLSPSPSPLHGAMLDFPSKVDPLADPYGGGPYLSPFEQQQHAALASHALRPYHAEAAAHHMLSAPFAEHPGADGPAPRFVSMEQVSPGLSPAARYAALPDVCDPRFVHPGFDSEPSSASSDTDSVSGGSSPARVLRARTESLVSTSSSGDDAWESDPALAADDDDDEEYTPTRKRRALRSAAASAYQRDRAYSSSSTASNMAEMLVPDQPLMKKTRGRRVPTKDEVIAGGLTQVCIL